MRLSLAPNTNPIALLAVVNTGMALAVAFDAPLDAAQQAAIIAFVNACLTFWLAPKTTSTTTLAQAAATPADITSVAEDEDARLLVLRGTRVMPLPSQQKGPRVPA